jgi:hypothetical protein
LAGYRYTQCERDRKAGQECFHTPLKGNRYSAAKKLISLTIVQTAGLICAIFMAGCPIWGTRKSAKIGFSPSTPNVIHFEIENIALNSLWNAPPSAAKWP